MKAEQLRPILQHYSQQLTSVDPATARKLETFAERFGQLARVISDDFWNSSDALIIAVTLPKSATSKAQPVRLDVVRSYSDELARLEHDNNAFDQLIARIKSDRMVRKQEMHEIACRFFGYRVTLGTKEKLLQKIADLQAKDARQEVRTKS
jgi:hypothetical protein